MRTMFLANTFIRNVFHVNLVTLSMFRAGVNTALERLLTVCVSRIDMPSQFWFHVEQINPA